MSWPYMPYPCGCAEYLGDLDAPHTIPGADCPGPGLGCDAYDEPHEM